MIITEAVSRESLINAGTSSLRKKSFIKDPSYTLSHNPYENQRKFMYKKSLAFQLNFFILRIITD